jgi:hypothetical protein
MYRHGLGDCFLLTFPQSDGKPVHMLIDCGIVLGTSEPGTVMKLVAEDVKSETGGELDLLVITHEHWDHLSGFDEKQARDVFDQINVKTLWLAWTEDETDDLANQLRDERERKKAAAKKAKELAEARGLDKQAKALGAVLGFFGARAAGDTDAEAEDGGGTKGALDYLKKKCRPTILQTNTQTTIPGVKGARCYVMGPPKDNDALKRTNPSKGEGYGFGGQTIGLTEAFLAAFDPNDERAQPFSKGMRLSLDELKSQAPAANTEPIPGLHGYYHPANASRNIDNDWLSTGARLALQLDNATNNTSLVLAIELAGSNDVLLFVGDAQAGNWRSWPDCAWRVKEDGETRDVTSADLLRRTIFYKVGHHGSHNATLRDKGLELMTSDRLVAVIPVDTKVAHEVKGWEHMPLPEIRARLEEKCAVIFQSDLAPKKVRDIPGARWEDAKTEFEVRMKDPATKKVKTDRQRPLYTDYFL